MTFSTKINSFETFTLFAKIYIINISQGLKYAPAYVKFIILSQCYRFYNITIVLWHHKKKNAGIDKIGKVLVKILKFYKNSRVRIYLFKQ